jgi:hypothetical protein
MILKSTYDVHDVKLCDAQWKPASQMSDPAFVLRVIPRPNDTPLLGCANIQALRGEEVIFQLSVCWQEVQQNARS